jgi:hypothetical protein
MVPGHMGKVTVRPCFRNKPGMVVHDYNASYASGIERRIVVHAGTRPKYKTLSEK